jgi:WD40 repeat protein
MDDDPDTSGDEFERMSLDELTPHSAPFTPGAPTPLTRRRLMGYVAGIALFAVLGVTLFQDRLPTLLSMSAQGRSTVATQAPPPPIPAFSDWRVAYIGKDARLHIVSLDGKTDLSGPYVPSRHHLGEAHGGMATAPDGHSLAYPTSLGVVVARLTPGHVPIDVINGLYFDLSWSPNSDLLALGSRGSSISLWRPGETEARVVYERSSERVNSIGWIDERHLAILVGVNTVTVASLDLVSGVVQPLTTFLQEQVGVPQFTMAPHGKQILLSSCSFHDQHFNHRLGVIDTATGEYHTLDNTRAKTDSCLESLAFQADTGRLIASQEKRGNPVATTWMLDIAHDTATKTPVPGFPVAWAPANGPMITSSGHEVVDGYGPYTIRAALPSASSAALTLTTTAMTFPALGLVRTA